MWIGAPCSRCAWSAAVCARVNVDFARFLRAILRPSTTDHIGTPQVAAMLQPHVQPDNPDDKVAWGLGWGLEDTDDAPAFWHWGDNPGFKSLIVAYPATQASIVIMTNGDAGLGLCAHLVCIIIGGDHPAFDWLATTFYDTSMLASMSHGLA